MTSKVLAHYPDGVVDYIIRDAKDEKIDMSVAQETERLVRLEGRSTVNRFHYTVYVTEDGLHNEMWDGLLLIETLSYTPDEVRTLMEKE